MNKAAFNVHLPKSVHGPLLAAGLAILVFTLVGVALVPIAGWFQGSSLEAAGSVDQPRDAEPSAAAGAGTEPRAKSRCKYCGIIESTRQVGGVHEVTVRLADRSTQVFSDTSPANWRPGERIILIGGGNSPRR